METKPIVINNETNLWLGLLEFNGIVSKGETTVKKTSQFKDQGMVCVT